MALDLFRVLKGLDISADDLASNVHVLQGTGAPGGDGGEQDDAPIGSLYLRNDTNTATGQTNLQIYWKHHDNNSVNDWALGASKSYVDSVAQGLSWREPAVVMVDTASTLASITTDLNDDLGLDGILLNSGDRVVLRNVTNGTKNVYIVTGTPGYTGSPPVAGATLVEDTNTLTDGDALLVLKGTHADEQWMWDDTTSAWVQFGGAVSTDELGYIRAFIGKSSAGAETPTYLSTDIVDTGKSLEMEISHLDDAIGTLQFTTPSVLTSYDDDPGQVQTWSSSYDITSNLKALDDTYGNGAITNIGNYYALTDEMQWHTNGTLTLTDALNALNNAVGNRNYTGNILTDGQSITASLEEIDTTIGDIDNSSTYTSGGYLPAATIAGYSIQQTFNSFNQVLGDYAEQTYINTLTNISTTTDLESGALAETAATEVQWILQYRDHNGGSPSSRRRGVIIHAISDGGGVVDFNLSSILRTGTTLTGVEVTVTISPGGFWQVNLNPGSNVLDATLKRVTYSYLG